MLALGGTERRQHLDAVVELGAVRVAGDCLGLGSVGGRHVLADDVIPQVCDDGVLGGVKASVADLDVEPVADAAGLDGPRDVSAACGVNLEVPVDQEHGEGDGAHSALLALPVCPCPCLRQAYASFCSCATSLPVASLPRRAISLLTLTAASSRAASQSLAASIVSGLVQVLSRFVSVTVSQNRPFVSPICGSTCSLSGSCLGTVVSFGVERHASILPSAAVLCYRLCMRLPGLQSDPGSDLVRSGRTGLVRHFGW